ncbi:hypothetical protein EGI22_23605 [Lacihabitans sp. LS3-19]|uniref:hypothetical protein n=1 Tax=Lacihabitans sp. LS3-19 TaxID=2487335 RepID=UPI0020CE6F94|nr:hypothetical protein [Lacihabitans sp. LS3-19]MCP9770902.1 hypothetical protein [Lacihabitans sp. LS3-19]
MKHIGGNLYINNEAVEIVDFLVDNNLLPNPVNKAFSKISQLGMDLDLIMYNPDEPKNKFLHYKFVDFASNSDTLQYLISMFRNLAVENYGFYTPAQRKLEEFLYMLPTYRALFGYKYNEDKETFEKDLNNQY